MRAFALLAIGALLVAWLLAATAPGGTLRTQAEPAGASGADPAFAARIGLGRAPPAGLEPGGSASPRALSHAPELAPRAAQSAPLPWSMPAEFAPSDPLR